MALQHTIFKMQDLKLSNFVYANPFNMKGDTVIRMFYNQNKQKMPILIELPQIYNNDHYNNTDYIILPIMSNEDDNTMALFKFFDSLDKQIINDLKNNIKKWVPNIKSAMYKEFVSELEDDESDIYKLGAIKLRIRESEFKTKFWDNDRNNLSDRDLSTHLIRGAYLKIIIELKGIHISKNEDVALIVRTHQIKVLPPLDEIIELNDYSFRDDNNDKPKYTNASKVKPKDVIKNKLLNNNVVKDNLSDDDEDESIDISNINQLINNSSDDEDDDNDDEEEEEKSDDDSDEFEEYEEDSSIGAGSSSKSSSNIEDNSDEESSEEEDNELAKMFKVKK